QKFAHGALDDGCTTCHNLHDDNIDELQGLASLDLCAQCHDTGESHAHPYGGKHVDPRTGQPLTCVSCHEPHSAAHEFMLEFDRNRDLCIQCHVSGTMKAH
ncbi:MAG: cytochrome c3 family protein, partial [Candidatus Latescibacterota bacterium]